jgi:ribosomal protein L18
MNVFRVLLIRFLEGFQFNYQQTVQDAAKKVGEFIGKACLEKGISKVSFDKGSFVYHGRIKALADAAREAGLEF